MKTMLALSLAGLLLCATPAIDAHHSIAMFDTGTAVTLKGTLRRAELANPHSYLHLAVETPDGTVEWAVEGPAPNQLARRGISDASFAEGAVYEACGYVLQRNPESPGTGRRVLVAEILVAPDGQARLWSPYGQSLCRAGGNYADAE